VDRKPYCPTQRRKSFSVDQGETVTAEAILFSLNSVGLSGLFRARAVPSVEDLEATRGHGYPSITAVGFITFLKKLTQALFQREVRRISRFKKSREGDSHFKGEKKSLQNTTTEILVILFNPSNLWAFGERRDSPITARITGGGLLRDGG